MESNNRRINIQLAAELSKDFPKNLRTPWKDLLKAARSVLYALECCGYGGSNKTAEKKHEAILRAAIKACEALEAEGE